MGTAERIQTLRKQRGISQEELAGQIGVSRQAVSKWESGQSVPDPEKIVLLSDFFGVTTDSLLRECGESAPRIVRPGEESETESLPLRTLRAELDDDLLPIFQQEQRRKRTFPYWLTLLFPAVTILAVLIVYFIWFRS